MSSKEEQRNRRRKRKKEARRKKKRLENADAINDRLVSLRMMLYEGASHHNWTRICHHFDQWPDDDTLIMGLDYASNHLATWPVEYCNGVGQPKRWLERHLNAEREPRVALLRNAELNFHSPPTLLAKLLKNPIFKQVEGLGLSAQLAHPGLQLLHNADLSHIRWLDLSSNQLSDARLLKLLTPQKLPNLCGLNLSRNRLTSHALHTLLERGMLAKLTWLNLSYTDLNGTALAGLAAADAMPHLRRLELDGQHALSDLSVLRALLKEHGGRLEHLSLLYCALQGHPAGVVFADADLPSLVRLDLSRNKLGSRGLEALSFMNAPALTHLGLEGNSIALPGWRALEKAPLLKPRTLKILYNPTDPEIVRALLLNALPSLQNVSVPQTNYYDYGENPLRLTASELNGLLQDTSLPTDIHAMVLSRLRFLDPDTVRRFATGIFKEHTASAPLHDAMRDWLLRNIDLLRVIELRQMNRDLKVKGYSRFNKGQLIGAVRKALRTPPATSQTPQ